jgi:hypothetical protein
MKDELGTILDAYHTPPLTLDLKKLPKDAPEMAVIAHEYAKGKAEDELKLKLARVVIDCEYDGLYKHVEVNMRGVNGNSLVILGTIKKALKQAGADSFQIQVFMSRAMSDDYQHLLKTCSKWVTIVDRKIETQHAGSAFAAFNSQEEDK